MKVDIEPTLFAVGALIVCEHEFVAVTEKNTSRKSVKIAGQETHPMETIEDIDADDFASLARACTEEVAVDLSKAEKIVLLNIVETRPGVELRNYLIKVPSKNLVGTGSFVEEVTPIRWIPLEEAIQAKGQLRFRPAVHETVLDNHRYNLNPKVFQPGEHRHIDLADQIPAEIYDLVDSGINGKEAVSQYLSRLQP